MGNIHGAILMVLSMAAFAVEDMFIKLAAQSIPVGQILFVVGVGGALAFAGWSLFQGRPALTRAMFTGPTALRSIAEAIGSTGFVAALALVPLSVVTTIIQANPLLVTLGAALFMGEKVGWRRWSAISLGLMGVLIVLRPFGDGFQLAALLAVMGVVAQTARDLATRKINRDVSSIQISTMGFLALVPAGLIVLAISGQGFVVPDRQGAAYLVGAVLIGIPALYAVIASMRVGDISFVAPFRYVRIIFGLLVGAFVFAETIDGYTLLGAGIIVSSGLYAFMRETRLRRRASLSTTAAL